MSQSRLIQGFNVAVLSTSYMLHSSSLFMQASSTTVTAREIVKSQGLSENLSSLPFSLLFITSACIPPLLSYSFIRFNFRPTFIACMLFGIVGSVLGILSIYWQNYALICLASGFLGIPNTAGNFFRFTVLQLVEPQYASKSVSAVLVSGLAASFLGPVLADQTYQAFDGYLYMGVYVSIACIYCVLLTLMMIVQYPKSNVLVKEEKKEKDEEKKREFNNVASEEPEEEGDESSGLIGETKDEPTPPTKQAPELKKRTLVQILTTPVILVAMLGAGICYLVMIALMTIIPIIMEDNNLDFNDITNTMTVHGVGMFLPFFFVGWFIDLLGDVWIAATGLCILCLSILFFILSTATWTYYVGMAFVGIGWCFTFFSCTTLLSKQYNPLERPMVQATNDVIVFGLVAIATTLALPIYNSLSEAAFMWTMFSCCLAGLIFTSLYGVSASFSDRRKKLSSTEERKPFMKS